MNTHDRYDSLFHYYAHGLDPLDLKAQAIAESNLDPRAISSCGAEGLAQFLPATFQDVMPGGDVYNPETNIQAQAKYMDQLVSRYGYDLTKAWAAYNWGMGNLDRCLHDHGPAWRDHLPTETTNYLHRIASIRSGLV